MSLIQPLFQGKIDIIGDIHGEHDALITLMQSLGYDLKGNHPENRKLIFVGDLCDRGPDSPGVIFLINELIQNGNAQAILGNHEMNLLQHKSKEGAGWYFKDRIETDTHYKPFNIVNEVDRTFIYDFLASLPIALEREDLRIIHAAWDNDRINTIRTIPLGQAAHYYNQWETEINDYISSSGLLQRYHKEQEQWPVEKIDSNSEIPFLENTCEYNLVHQVKNPFRVLTSGVEQRCQVPFYASGKWRFVGRHPWWDDYEDKTPVIVGHFWRKLKKEENPHHYAEPSLFDGVEHDQWHGKNHNVFCVDYSVGGRFKERNHQSPLGQTTQLVALRWPERELVLENGETIPTQGFLNFTPKMKI